MKATIWISVLLTTFFIFACSQGPRVDAGEDLTAVEGQDVKFSATLTESDISKETRVIKWDFGDGEVVEGTLTPTHRYLDDGKYFAVLTITENGRKVASDKVTVNVSNSLPEAQIVSQIITGCEGEPVYLQGRAKDAGVEDSFTFEWDMNLLAGEFGADVQGEEVEYVWPTPGTKKIGMRAIDDDGGISEIVGLEIEILKKTECVYGPDVLGVRLGMPIAEVADYLEKNGLKIIEKSESSITVERENCWGNRYSFTADENILSEIQIHCGGGGTCSPECNTVPGKRRNLLPPNVAKYMEREKESQGESEKRTIKNFWREGPRVFEMTTTENSFPGGGTTSFELLTHDSNIYQPRFSIEATGVHYPSGESLSSQARIYTHVNYPVSFKARGWDPVTGKEPTFVWDVNDTGSYAASGSTYHKAWQSPGKSQFQIRVTAKNNLVSTLDFQVEVDDVLYDGENEKFYKSLDKDLLPDSLGLVWGKPALNDKEVSFLPSKVDGLYKADIMEIAQRYNYVEDFTVYQKNNGLAGYKVTLRTPSLERRWLFDELNRTLKFLSFNGRLSLNLFDPLPGNNLSFWENEALYVRIGEELSEPNMVEFEVLYKPLWEPGELKNMQAWSPLFGR